MTHRFLNPYEVISSIDTSSLGRVVDMGSGIGYWNNALHAKSSEIISIDSNASILQANKIIPHTIGYAPRHSKIVADMGKENSCILGNNIMDTGLISNLFFQLSHEEKIQCVKEAKRMLRKGGRVLVVDWNGSWNGLGPLQENVVSEVYAQKLFIDEGFNILQKPLYTGGYHYGFVAEL